MTDVDLVRRAERGDHAAFETLYRKYNELAINVARKVTKSPLLADEAASELWLWLVTGRWRMTDAVVTPTGEIHAFVSTLARYAAWKCAYVNAATRRTVPMRNDNVDRSPVYRLRSTQPNPEQQLLQKELADRIWAINRGVLPPVYRQTIEFYYREGLTTREIAEILNVGSTTIPGYLHQARSRMKPYIQRDGSPSPRPLPAHAPRARRRHVTD